MEAVRKELSSHAEAGDGVTLVETAGAVLSPSPSGKSQADLYRPLRLPVLLVADAELGGIGISISAFESLHLRGYDVESIVLFKDQRYGNYDYLRGYFEERGISTYALPRPPERKEADHDDEGAMSDFYESASQLESTEALVSEIFAKHDSRIQQLSCMPRRADEHIWHPFTQHQTRKPGDVMAIDSAYGDFFQVWDNRERSPDSSERNDTQSLASQKQTHSLIQSTFDGSASWWTQGLGHGNPELALAAAYASGRYGHVMFAGAIHEPALNVAELLLAGLQNPRLAKVFYTDNGSTGMEVAVKMALRATCLRYGWDKSDVQVLGLKGSYHGDTIGVMNCSEPSTFNEKVTWYSGQGFWFDFPQVKVRKGAWIVEPPIEMDADFGPTIKFDSLDDVFDFKTRDNSLYESYIKRVIEKLVKSGTKFGALVMEPILLGAGGMLFA